jgi:hypothetical protein
MIVSGHCDRSLAAPEGWDEGFQFLSRNEYIPNFLFSLCCPFRWDKLLSKKSYKIQNVSGVNPELEQARGPNSYKSCKRVSNRFFENSEGMRQYILRELIASL